MPDLKLYTPPPPIREAWRPLAQHADECDICLPYVSRLVGAADPRRTDFEVYEELCETGKELFTPWRLAKDDWLAETLPRRQRQFITDDQLAADGVSFELRGEAIMSMPAEEFKAWLALPDERRHAQLLALEAWLRSRKTSVNGQELTERHCRLCSEAFKVPRDSKDRYCCEEHAREGWKR